jgi:hypothetical protein
MAGVLAFMTTGKLLVANIVALRNERSTDNWWLQESCPTGTWLRLTINNRTSFA